MNSINIMPEKQTTVKVGTVSAKDGSIEVVISAPKSPSFAPRSYGGVRACRRSSNRLPCHAPLLPHPQVCGAKGVPFSGGTAGSRTAATVLDEGALKKDLAEAKAPAADTVDSDAETHTTEHSSQQCCSN